MICPGVHVWTAYIERSQSVACEKVSTICGLDDCPEPMLFAGPLPRVLRHLEYMGLLQFMILILHHLQHTILPQFLGFCYIRFCRICVINSMDRADGSPKPHGQRITGHTL